MIAKARVGLEHAPRHIASMLLLARRPTNPMAWKSSDRRHAYGRPLLGRTDAAGKMVMAGENGFAHVICSMYKAEQLMMSIASPYQRWRLSARSIGTASGQDRGAGKYGKGVCSSSSHNQAWRGSSACIIGFKRDTYALSSPKEFHKVYSPHATLQTHAFDFWLARGAVALIAGLQFLFVNNNLIFGPRWLAPAFELAMLIPLSIATVWTQGRVRHAEGDGHWHVICRHRKLIRHFALLLTAIVMILNFYALVSVTRELLGGAKGGQSLLLDALNIWFTNIIVFALWFWNIDRGGPARLGLHDDKRPDFLFPQMMGTGDDDPAWSPGFVDYFYVSFTNATAFSPTDTMPLSAQSKLLMAAEATISLLTVGLVAARAVNILT